ncbi:hypothetical protein [Flavobacterium beibuense]|uniref:Lipoprotein n=1 Tax=Flavobacterium beibuense TaxID=657326 RepID=A0A444W8F0_9FLAO|nr:hypothetical protein [Flavobacterium beibuense]RYJ42022.1 hypothetical protein NU09_2426 [Flavobacterium beibuense]
MKKIIYFLALAATAAFTSCNNDDDSGNNSENQVTAITLTSSTESIIIGEGSFTFTVKDQNGNTLTDATLTANQTAITSPWTPDATGTYTIKASYGQLTDELTVTVNEVPQTVNTFAIDGTEYATTDNIMLYLGTDTGVNYWILLAYSATGEGEEMEIVNESDIMFTTLQTSETNLDFPTPQTITFGEQNPGTKDAYIAFNTDNEVYTTDAITSLELTINSINLAETADEQFINYNYTLELNDGTVITGTFDGSWGFLNASGRPGRSNNPAKQVINVSKAEILQKVKSRSYLK